MSIYTPTFWRDALERSISTIAQTLIALLSVDLTGIVDVAGFDWAGIALTAGLAGVLSVLKSIAAATKDGNASVGSVNEVKPKSGQLGQ